MTIDPNSNAETEARIAAARSHPSSIDAQISNVTAAKRTGRGWWKQQMAEGRCGNCGRWSKGIKIECEYGFCHRYRNYTNPTDGAQCTAWEKVQP